MARDAVLELALGSNEFAMRDAFGRRGGLGHGDLLVAAVLADVDALAGLLAGGADVNAAGGPRNCPALVYLSHSGFWRFDPDFRRRQLECAQLLFAHGADANAGPVNEHGQVFSALYGAVRWPGYPELCALLLGHGARVSDGESLYHASELEDLRCLALLLAHGPDPQDRDWCVNRMIDQDNAAGLRLYLEHGTSPHLLGPALFRERSIDCLKVLIEHGADVDQPCPDDWLRRRVAGLTPVQIAERDGYDAAIDLLLAAGAKDNRGPRDFLIGACARVDRPAVQRLLDAHRGLVASLSGQDHSNLAALARAGRWTAVELMLDIGFDIEAKADDMVCSALLYTAMGGNAELTRALVARGADLGATHKYGGDALGSCIYCAANFRNPSGDYAGVVKLLLEAGMQPREDQLAFAREHGLHDIAALLAAQGGSARVD